MTAVCRLLALLLVLPCLVAQAGQYNKVIDIGAAMPAFSTLPATDGTQLSSTELDTDIVVLVALANHCPWVQGMDQGLVALVNQFKGQSVRVIGFSVNHREADRLPAMKEHGAKVGYNFSYVYDESQALGRALGATRTPEYFVFDKSRKLVYMGLLTNSPAHKTMTGAISYTNGEPSQFYVAEAIRAALAGTPVAVPETRAQGCTVEYES
jgi:peroxiredoxin